MTAADRAQYGVVPLAVAVLCQDCSLISAAQHQCPGCASEVLLTLRTVLNRETEETAAPMALQKGVNIA